MDDINKKIQDLIELRNIQGRKGNYDYDDYMLGLFNGLELAVSTLEGREPNFKSKEVAEKKIKVIKKDI